MSHQVVVYFISGGGFALGLFSSALLIARKGALGQADRVLAALLLVCAVNAVHPMLGVLAPLLMPHDVYGVFEPSEFLFGPLIYAYFRSLLFKPHHLRARLLLHALPMALSVLVYALTYGNGGGPAARLIPLVLWACLLAQMCAYLIPGWHLVHVYQAGLPDERSSTRGIDLGWLHWFSALVLALVLSTGIVMVLLAAGAASTLSRGYLALSVSVVTAILGFRGLLQVSEPAREVMEHRETVPAATRRPAGIPPVKPPLDAAAAGALHERLRAYMENDKPFLDPELSLVSLAARLGVGRNQLSWVINNLEGKRFFDYINTFRVQAVMEMLKDPSRAGEKLIGLAFDAGFNSKPTFNAAFKKHTGRPPSHFRV